jgi:hypothetical protein
MHTGKIKQKFTLQPDFHDGHLDGILLENGKKLILNCRDVTNQRWEITISKLRRLSVDNFLEGNIIFEVNVFNGPECSSALIKKVYGLNDPTDTKVIADYTEEAIVKKWTLVELTSSYGCELLALSEALPNYIQCVLKDKEGDVPTTGDSAKVESPGDEAL